MRVKSGIAIAALAFASIFCAGASSQTFKTIHTFDGADGSGPSTALVQATDGNLYGTTTNGGANDLGVAFKITTSGTIKTLYSFGPDSLDGQNPTAELIQSTNGSLYGTTSLGGSHGDGTVFKMTMGGSLTTLYSFCSQGGNNCTDGSNPSALVHSTNGNFYGTTAYDGSNGYGTVFSITPSGMLTTIYSFSITDGYFPSPLIQAPDGDLYGTINGGPIGNGSFFKITLSGALKTIYKFCSKIGCSDGANPSRLIQGADGNFYGTTEYGGSNNYGTIFKITPNGELTTLHSFCSQRGCPDGESPIAGLVQATDENLYGTTEYGGADTTDCLGGCGTVFKITPSGSLTTIHSFCLGGFPCIDGSNPEAPLIQETNGILYGSSTFGVNDFGTLFSLSVGLKPFVKTQPGSGRVGSLVKILGTNLNGATRVRFNGVAAVFTVISASEITAFVPNGATTGKVDVVTPSWTLVSNVKFRVTP
jgi:uncharacterized repeat protein (TIGR03803 family)